MGTRDGQPSRPVVPPSTANGDAQSDGYADDEAAKAMIRPMPNAQVRPRAGLAMSRFGADKVCTSGRSLIDALQGMKRPVPCCHEQVGASLRAVPD